jgi:hypothetical protein
MMFILGETERILYIYTMDYQSLIGGSFRWSISMPGDFND